MAKRIVPGFKIFDAQAMATSSNSVVSNVQNLDKASVLVEWSGTSPVGVLTAQAQNKDDGSWYDLDFGSVINVTGNTGSHTLIFNELPFVNLRLAYTATSGTGSLSATIMSKAVGS